MFAEEGQTVRETTVALGKGSGRCVSTMGCVHGAGRTCNPVVAQVWSEAPTPLGHWGLLVEGDSWLRRQRGKVRPAQERPHPGGGKGTMT